MSEFLSGYAQFLSSNYLELIDLIITHLRLAIIANIIAITIGIPLGVLIATKKKLERPVLGFANIMQAVPSLAALGLLVPIIGIGSPPAILMVVLYSLLPILKNTYTGLVNINPQMIEAASGIGMTPFQVLTRVRLPLAMPVIMSGVRISAVTSVGLMTIAAYIGAGGLGNYVISGIQTSNSYLMLSGAIPACLLALLMDFAISKLEKAVMPISLATNPATLTREHIVKLKAKNRRVISAAMAVAVMVVGSFGFSYIAESQSKAIIVSSKPEAEGVIVGNIIAFMIEEHTDLEVERNLGMGATKIVYSALENGEIDVYPEYSGSVYGGIYQQEFKPGMTPEDVAEEATLLMADAGITYLDMYGLNNKYCIGVMPELADQYGLKTITDLQRVADNFVFGSSQEFPHRADGLPAVNAVYGDVEFKEILQFQGALMYEALITGNIDVMTPFATDALILEHGVVILEDDKSALSSYTMSTAINSETANEYPELIPALSMLEGQISDEEMIAMNYEVVVNQRSHSEVAWEFLVSKGLVTE